MTVIYLDNAATSMHKPEEVIQAVVEAMRSLGNASRGTHGSSLNASRLLYNTRVKLANFFGCKRADHVIYTANSTEALNIAIGCVINEGEHIISTDLEHNSVLRPLYRLEKDKNVELSFVAADKESSIDYEEFEKLLQPNTRAIVCTHASNLTGYLVDIARVGEIAHKHGLIFIVDASQTAGVFPIDMGAMHIDILCFTGHKGMYGPQGTGGLCINSNIDFRPFKVGGTGVKTHDRYQPEEFPAILEAGTHNSHGIAGLSAALDFLLDTGIDKIRSEEQALARKFYNGIKDIEGVKLYGDYSVDRAAIVTFNIEDHDSSEVSDELSEVYHIATRGGTHCAPRLHDALGTTRQGAVRFSFSYFNTEEEVDMAVKAIREMVN